VVAESVFNVVAFVLDDHSQQVFEQLDKEIDCAG